MAADRDVSAREEDVEAIREALNLRDAYICWLLDRDPEFAQKLIAGATSKAGKEGRNA